MEIRLHKRMKAAGDIVEDLMPLPEPPEEDD